MPWRKRLGASEKAPIDKLQNAAVSKIFGVVSGSFCAVIGYFAPVVLVNFINFLSKNTGGQSDVGPEYDTLQYIRIACAGIGFFAMFLRS